MTLTEKTSLAGWRGGGVAGWRGGGVNYLERLELKRKREAYAEKQNAIFREYADAVQRLSETEMPAHWKTAGFIAAWEGCQDKLISLWREKP